MKIRTGNFPRGSSYYPPFHAPEDWVRDTANMAAADMNMMRTAELLATWDYIEPERGKPDWSWLDRIFELSQENGIQILLGTGSCCPPIWMVDDYPDLQAVSREGTKFPTNSYWGWACVNNPGMDVEVARYVNLLIDRYGSHPALMAWQIDNEPGSHPAFGGEAERRAPKQNAYFCYCERCAELFREWVAAKYHNIEALNAAWAWDPTHHRYVDWRQINPPRSLPAEWGNATAWLDFRRFVRDSFTRFVKRQHDVIKARDQIHPTSTNLVTPLRYELEVNWRGIDHWAVGEVVDVIGYDMYPQKSFKIDPAHSSWFMDFAYSVAKHNDRTLWMPELESGPVGGFSAGPLHTTRPTDITRHMLSCLGHGAKMIAFQGYREWNCIPLHWGALVDLDGDPTGRYYSAANVNRVIKEHEDFFLDSLPAKAGAAIYFTHDNASVLDGQANEEFLYGAIHGVYNALWYEGFNVEFVAPQFLGTPTADYEVLFLPFLMHLPQDDADRITQFVEDGGTVVGFAKLGHLDEKGWSWNRRPGAGLTALFGARETSIEVFDRMGWAENDAPGSGMGMFGAPVMHAEVLVESEQSLAIAVEPGNPLFEGIDSETIQGYWHRQEFDIQDDVEVLARFVDGAPAILRRVHGRGQAILMATHLDLAVVHHDDPATRKLFANLLEMCGVERPVVVSGADQGYVQQRVDAHLLELGNQRAVLINNEGETDVDLVVTVPSASGMESAVELLSGESIVLKGEGGARFEITLPASAGVIVMLSDH